VFIFFQVGFQKPPIAPMASAQPFKNLASYKGPKGKALQHESPPRSCTVACHGSSGIVISSSIHGCWPGGGTHHYSQQLSLFKIFPCVPKELVPGGYRLSRLAGSVCLPSGWPIPAFASLGPTGTLGGNAKRQMTQDTFVQRTSGRKGSDRIAS